MNENAPARALIALSDLDRGTLEDLLEAAEGFIASDAATAHRKQLAGEAVALVFCEPSTRTRFSFELAARRLGADVIAFDEPFSSRVKGESLSETFRTLAAMGVRFFVLRHGENGIMRTLTGELPAGTCLISGGEGTHAHPTQGLLDAFTIRLHRPELARLTVAVIGDIVHSRVARSTITALTQLGVDELHLVGPDAFLPAPGELPGTTTTELASGLANADVVIALRIQRERMAAAEFPDPRDYRERYGLSIERIECYAKPDALLLHPGPVNWGVELDAELADWPRSLIREQVRNGVAVRMAVFAWLAEAAHGRG
ncbi:MAG: aspartate carbamoyltransferase catalytic subunit [Gammaproteobacteria bacterium]